MTTTVSVVGNLTREPELRFTPAGKAVADFGVAVNTRRKDGDNWVDGDPEFYDVTAWGTLAENVAESLEKGARVVVVGRLRYETWQTDGGENRSKVKVTAEAIGPDLRWATAEVQRTDRREAPKQEAVSFGDEPF
jgi:single-strand DNA-binding protein